MTTVHREQRLIRKTLGPLTVHYPAPQCASAYPVAMPRTPRQQAEGDDLQRLLANVHLHGVVEPSQPLPLSPDGTEVVTWAGEMVQRLPQSVVPRPALPKGWRRYPLTDFTATAVCPGCGDIQVHWLRLPELPQPLPEPEVIRECANCGEEWGQK